ncbi:hypothetical protein COOONC_02845 [Cooperia oncophora]
MEQFLIMVFNIHRVLIFLRPHWIKKFYVVFTPVVAIYAIAYGIAKSLSMDLMESIMGLLFVPSILVTSVVCFVLIRRHFRTNSGYTEKVKQMQTRLSTSLCLEAIRPLSSTVYFYVQQDNNSKISNQSVLLVWKPAP